METSCNGDGHGVSRQKSPTWLAAHVMPWCFGGRRPRQPGTIIIGGEKIPTQLWPLHTSTSSVYSSLCRSTSLAQGLLFVVSIYIKPRRALVCVCPAHNTPSSTRAATLYL